MPSRIADLRQQPKNKEEAAAVFAEIANLECRLAVEDAKLEKRIADLKTKHAESLKDDVARMAELENALSEFIKTNQRMFNDPKKIKTPFGTFGLQKVSELLITDEKALLDFLMENGYDDCFERIIKPIKTAIRTRAELQFIPGCKINSGETVVMTVSKALIKDAVEEAG